VRGKFILLLTTLALSACAISDVQIKSGEMPEDQAVTYMILSDQLNRVRNIWPSEPPKACLVASMPGPAYMAGVGPIDPAILARLQQDNEKAAEKLEIDSSPACMTKFFGADGKLLREVDKGFVLLATGHDLGFTLFASNCREHEGAIYRPPNTNHIVTYDLRNENGMLSLVGGDPCVSRF
jgi:hypothetical protein